MFSLFCVDVRAVAIFFVSWIPSFLCAGTPFRIVGTRSPLGFSSRGVLRVYDHGERSLYVDDGLLRGSVNK